MVRGFSSGVDGVVGLLAPQMQRRVPGILGRPDSLFLDILVASLLFGQDPSVQGRCSFVEGHLKSSIVLARGDLVPFDHRIACSHNRMGGFVGYSEMDSVGHVPSI